MIRLICTLWIVWAMSLPGQAQTLTVFAAASLKNAFDDIGTAFEAHHDAEIVFSYAGTSLLARQIEQGAPADIFASAHRDWTHYLSARALLDDGSVVTFAGNSLVLIAPVDRTSQSLVALTSRDILAVLGTDGRLASALVSAVPAGLYAREAMENLSLWEALQPRLAQSDNVRAAMVLVARGEAPLGIVYASDAMAEPRIEIATRFPASSHAPIAYSAARVTASTNPLAEQFLAFLNSNQAQSILADFGFTPSPRDASSPIDASNPMNDAD